MEIEKVSNRSRRVCPVEIAGHLDNRFRRWVQNPQKILRLYIEEGMTVLDEVVVRAFSLWTWQKW